MRMKLHSIGVVLALLAAPATAEDWVFYRASGDAPDRQLGLVDRASIDRSAPEASRVRIALLSESPGEIPAQMLTQVVVDCAAHTAKMAGVELRDETGALLRTVDEEHSGPIKDGSPGVAVLELVCSDRWPEPVIDFPGKSLGDIYLEWFRPRP